jgi:hypothetical protein
MWIGIAIVVAVMVVLGFLHRRVRRGGSSMSMADVQRLEQAQRDAIRKAQEGPWSGGVAG